MRRQKIDFSHLSAISKTRTTYSWPQAYYYHYEVHYFRMGLKKYAYLLQIQFHFEIDALNTVSTKFEITRIFSTLQVTLNMLSSYHTLSLITIWNFLFYSNALFWKWISILKGTFYSEYVGEICNLKKKCSLIFLFLVNGINGG